MNAVRQKGTDAISKFCLSPYFPPAGVRNNARPSGSAGSLTRQVIVRTFILLYVDLDKPDCVALKKKKTIS